jgi:F-type H+-transporting ATPase subunit delta
LAQDESIVSGVGGRYALALYELAKEQGLTDQVAKDLENFAALIAESKDLKRLVSAPIYSAEEQLRALNDILAGAGISGISANFVKLVALKRRLTYIGDMIAGFHKLDDQDKGRVRAEVTAAAPLKDAHIEALKTALVDFTGGKSVAVDLKIDPEIIGGLVVKLGSRMIDGSLKTKLNSLRTRLKEVG